MSLILTTNSVERAFAQACMLFTNTDNYVSANSRNGKVLRVPGIVVMEHTNPLARVLQNSVRDCNPFFHVYEAMWMLAGREDVAPLEYYASNMKNYSDNGKTLHGAYGFRWRKYFGYDQIDWIIDELKANRESRRCVLQMWDGGRTQCYVDDSIGPDIQWDKPEAVEGTGDLYTALHGGKDVPCNLAVVFEIVEDKLNMTVFNRSNDVIWGALGANFVHFSFLHEYMAHWVGAQIGTYHQVSSNFHVYIEKHTESFLHKALAAHTVDCFPSTYNNWFSHGNINQAEMDKEIKSFVELNDGVGGIPVEVKWKNSFLDSVAQPMMETFQYHKARKYPKALETCIEIADDEWRKACTNWIMRRKEKYESTSSVKE